MTFATAEGTRNYFARKKLKVPPNPLGTTGLYVSPVGFGGYRIHEKSPIHRQALRHALRSGCNLIDTSTNYGVGSSERLIGEVLAELFSTKELSRDEVVIVTKAGYIQGPLLQQIAGEGMVDVPSEEIVRYNENCWHSIAPAFLKNQLDRSLERLKLKAVDCLLLHNPEYFLKVETDHQEYYARIRAAFEYLESEVESGRIQFYGVSSNTLIEPKGSPEFTSLELLLEIADDVAREEGIKSHFKIIQFPFNILEPEAVLESNNANRTVLELAQSRGLGTLANRPLNAFMRQEQGGARLIRLADVPLHDEVDVVEDLKQAFTAALQLENQYKGLAEKFEGLPALREIAWASILRANFEKLSELDTWKNIRTHQIEPSLAELSAHLSEHGSTAALPTVVEWQERFQAAIRELLDCITRFVESQAAAQSLKLATQLDKACPPLQHSWSLSRKVIRVCRSFPGMSAVLVGMREPKYVDDALSLEPVLLPEQAEQAVRAIHGAADLSESN